MPTVQPTVEPLGSPAGDTLRVTWANLANGDAGAPTIRGDEYADRSVQVTGTFGAGGNVRIEGSNDEAAYAALSDPQGDALNIGSAGIKQVLEITRLLRPSVTAGDGTTLLTVVMIARRTR